MPGLPSRANDRRQLARSSTRFRQLPLQQVHRLSLLEGGEQALLSDVPSANQHCDATQEETRSKDQHQRGGERVREEAERGIHQDSLLDSTSGGSVTKSNGTGKRQDFLAPARKNLAVCPANCDLLRLDKIVEGVAAGLSPRL